MSDGHRILMIAPTSFFLDYGCHVRILEEARALLALGQEVRIVTYYMGRDWPGLDIVRSRSTPWHADYEVGSSRHKIIFDVLLSWRALVETLRWKPDIIHGHLHEGALIGSVLGRLARIPVVFDFQGSLTAEMLDHHFITEGHTGLLLVASPGRAHCRDAGCGYRQHHAKCRYSGAGFSAGKGGLFSAG